MLIIKCSKKQNIRNPREYLNPVEICGDVISVGVILTGAGQRYPLIVTVQC